MEHSQLMKRSDNTWMSTTKATDTAATQSADMLELFAEELPEHRDLMGGTTFACISTVGTGGSTFSTLSSASSL